MKRIKPQWFTGTANPEQQVYEGLHRELARRAAAEGIGECCRRFTAAATTRRMSLSNSLLICSTIFRINSLTPSLLLFGT